jgi:predicted site-specific integrase-resolvase
MHETATCNVTSPKINTRQLAAHLGVSERTLANWRDSGKIPFVRITARCLRYNLAEVESALRYPKARA